MTEHKYAQVLRWIADGKRVQGKSIDSSEWVDVKEWGAYKFQLAFQDGEGGYQFRLVPRTVKVGDVEIEAPLDSAAHGSTAYFCDDFGAAHEIGVMLGSMHHAALLQSGRLFSSAEAAEAAHAAWVKLMRGDA